MKPTEIIICDDHSMFRNGIKLLIETEKIGKVIAEAENGKVFLEIIEKQTPDIVLMDIDMPVMNGIEAVKRAIAKYPEMKILVLSMFGEEKLYHEMINAGAKGFILKTSGKYELEKAIGEILAGECYFSNELLRKIIAGIGKPKTLTNEQTGEPIELSDREIEVLKLLCTGKQTSEIADELSLSPKTVEGYRTKLLTKTNSKNAVSLVLFAIKNKLIELN